MPYPLPPRRNAPQASRGGTMSQQRNQGINLSFINNARRHVKSSGAMVGSSINNQVTLTFPIAVKIVAISGFATYNLSTNTPNNLDTFLIQVNRQTGDKMFTDKVPGAAVLGTGYWPAPVDPGFHVSAGEALDIVFDEISTHTNTAYVVFWAVEER